MSQLETTVKELLNAFDRKDYATLRGMFAEDCQGVDEISRRWLRSGDEIGDYFAQLAPAISDISSELSDFREQSWGEVGLVTCWLEQDYTLDGERQHISAPTTVLLRRTDNTWRVALIHTIPLPEVD